VSFDSRFVCRCTGQAEVFDLKTDQFQVQQSPEMHYFGSLCLCLCLCLCLRLRLSSVYGFIHPQQCWMQMVNLAGTTDFAKRVQSEYLPLANGLAKCTGRSCNRPEPIRPAGTPLECYDVAIALDAPKMSL